MTSAVRFVVALLAPLALAAALLVIPVVISFNKLPTGKTGVGRMIA